MFVELRGRGTAPCHLLRYLQMSTEKLAKAYLWRTGKAPPKVHVGFVRFLKALLDRRPTELQSIAVALGFARAEDFEKWVAGVLPLAYALQNCAPSEAADGPNPEYPWPHDRPTVCPAEFEFPLWRELSETGKGRKLLQFVESAIASFQRFA